jgi:hypothetical protein
MKLFVSIILFSICIVPVVNAMDLVLVKEKTTVEFEAKGSPSMLTIKGLKGKGSGQLKIVANTMTGEILVDLNDFDTDIDTRNEHMKEKYLETSKSGFNISKLVLSPVQLVKDFPEKVKKIENQNIEGSLTLHGVEKKIPVQLVEMNMLSVQEATGVVTFKIKLSDFGIEVPSFAGVTIADEVSVRSSYTAKIVENKK